MNNDYLLSSLLTNLSSEKLFFEFEKFIQVKFQAKSSIKPPISSKSLSKEELKENLMPKFNSTDPTKGFRVRRNSSARRSSENSKEKSENSSRKPSISPNTKACLLKKFTFIPGIAKSKRIGNHQAKPSLSNDWNNEAKGTKHERKKSENKENSIFNQESLQIRSKIRSRRLQMPQKDPHSTSALDSKGNKAKDNNFRKCFEEKYLKAMLKPKTPNVFSKKPISDFIADLKAKKFPR